MEHCREACQAAFEIRGDDDIDPQMTLRILIPISLAQTDGSGEGGAFALFEFCSAKAGDSARCSINWGGLQSKIQTDLIKNLPGYTSDMHAVDYAMLLEERLRDTFSRRTGELSLRYLILLWLC